MKPNKNQFDNRKMIPRSASPRLGNPVMEPNGRVNLAFSLDDQMKLAKLLKPLAARSKPESRL